MVPELLSISNVDKTVADKDSLKTKTQLVSMKSEAVMTIDCLCLGIYTNLF